MLDLRNCKNVAAAAVANAIDDAAKDATNYQRKLFRDYLTALGQGRPHNLGIEITMEWDVLLSRLKDAWAKQLGLVPGKEGTITSGRKKPSPESLEKVNAGN